MAHIRTVRRFQWLPTQDLLRFQGLRLLGLRILALRVRAPGFRVLFKA